MKALGFELIAVYVCEHQLKSHEDISWYYKSTGLREDVQKNAENVWLSYTTLNSMGGLLICK